MKQEKAAENLIEDKHAREEKSKQLVLAQSMLTNTI